MQDNFINGVCVRSSLYNEKNKSVINILLNIIILVFFVILLLEIIFGSVFSGIYVGGDSMKETLIGAPTLGYDSNGNKILGSGGDYVYINKYSKPKQFDIVVVFDEAKGENIIKRVLAFGGDTVEIVDGTLFVNEKAIAEPYVTHNEYENYYNKSFYNLSKHVVAENCMFLLGDNRNVSDDSRNPNNGVNGDYNVKFLKGVVPKWSLKSKYFITKIYSFFHFGLARKA